MNTSANAVAVTVDDFMSRFALPLADAHAERIKAFVSKSFMCGLWQWVESTPPTLPGDICDLIIVSSPPSEIEANLIAAALIPTGRVVIIGAEDPAYDAFKLRFYDHGHMGACSEIGATQLWWGGPLRIQHTSQSVAPESLPTIVSFFTLNTPYEEEAARLKKCCEIHGLQHHIVGVDPVGSWEANCALKAGIMLDAWRELKRPVLWVDSDALIHCLPNLLANPECDFAVHKVDRWEFASGTIYFGQSERARAMLERWVERCNADTGVWDQIHLDRAWEDITRELPLETLWLPQSYTRIFDRHWDEGEDPNPVIEHFQASRRLKVEMSGGAVRHRPPDDPEVIAARRASRPRLI